MRLKGNTVEEVKREYKELAKRYHPDLGGNDELMKELNNEYQRRLEEVRSPVTKKNVSLQSTVVFRMEAVNELRSRVKNYSERYNITCIRNDYEDALTFRVYNGYEIKDLLKASGWFFYPQGKYWWKEVSRGGGWKGNLFRPKKKEKTVEELLKSMFEE